MQLNIYIPKEKAQVVRALDARARETGRHKSQLVIEAVERYLRAEAPRLGKFKLGIDKMPTRAELYEEWMERRS